MRAVYGLLVLLVIANVPTAFADSANATMRVSVDVVARTILTVDRQPDGVTVTQRDIERGYVELPAAVAFRVRSNARNGYRIEFEPLDRPFTRAAISWDRQLAVVSADGSWLTRSYEEGERAGTFSVRLDLAPGTKAGRYRWPVRFDAVSL